MALTIFSCINTGAVWNKGHSMIKYIRGTVFAAFYGSRWVAQLYLRSLRAWFKSELRNRSSSELSTFCPHFEQGHRRVAQAPVIYYLERRSSRQLP